MPPQPPGLYHRVTHYISTLERVGFNDLPRSHWLLPRPGTRASQTAPTHSIARAMQTTLRRLRCSTSVCISAGLELPFTSCCRDSAPTAYSVLNCPVTHGRVGRETRPLPLCPAICPSTISVSPTRTLFPSPPSTLLFVVKPDHQTLRVSQTLPNCLVRGRSRHSSSHIQRPIRGPVCPAQTVRLMVLSLINGAFFL